MSIDCIVCHYSHRNSYCCQTKYISKYRVHLLQHSRSQIVPSTNTPTHLETSTHLSLCHPTIYDKLVDIIIIMLKLFSDMAMPRIAFAFISAHLTCDSLFIWHGKKPKQIFYRLIEIHAILCFIFQYFKKKIYRSAPT